MLRSTLRSPPLPITPAQMGIWLGQQLDPENPAYWTAEYLELLGSQLRGSQLQDSQLQDTELDCERLQQAVRAAVLECEALHMRFVERDGTVWQQPGPVPEACCTLRAFDSVDPSQRRAAAEAWMQAQLRIPVDLEQGPLWHCHLLQLSPGHHLLLLQAHHILLDGFGFALLLRRIAALYNAAGDTARPAASELPLAPLQPVLDAECAYPDSPDYHRDQAFWRDRLQAQPAPARLTPMQPVSREVLRHRLTLPAARLQRWQQSAQRLQADWFCWLAAGVALWLYDQTGRNQLTLGVPVMNRLGSPALKVPCMHMNIVPLPITVDLHSNLRQLVQQIQRDWQACRPHLRYRYESMKQDLALGSGRRLFGPVLNLMPFDRPLPFGAVQASSHPLSAGPVEDLALNILPQREQCVISIEANADAYTLAQLEQHGQQLLTLLDALAAPNHQPLYQRIHQQHRGHTLLNGLLPAATSALSNDASGQSITQALLQHARQRPRHTAIISPNGQRLSYGQLLPEVQSLAGILAEQGIEPGDRIALLLPRRSQTLVAMLACLWVGASYIPLDPAGPRQRAQRIVEHADPHLTLVDASLPQDWRREPWLEPRRRLDLDQAGSEVPQPLPMLNPVPVTADQPAYLLYTSGSTGTPNGVVIGRGALDHFCVAASQRYGIHADDTLLQFAPLHFDASVEEIFLALTQGATLVLRADNSLDSMAAFLDQCAAHAISVLDLPTAFWHELVFAIAHTGLSLPPCVRIVIIGGEAALPAQLALWQQQVSPQVQLINTYGPTETTVVCTSAHLTSAHRAGSSISIGTPLPGLQTAVVDADALPVLPGDSGELCVLGPTLANGYWQNPALTAQRFIQLDWLPECPRAYRTGDRVLQQADGTLLYLGRQDDELKISGQRISPTAIENVISAHPQVRECAVLAVETPARVILVAFLTTVNADANAGANSNGNAQPIAGFEDWLQPQLLAAAMPTQLHWRRELPRNANNKIDRRRLRQAWLDQNPVQEAVLNSMAGHQFSAMEAVIADVWQRILGIAPRDRNAEFFALGGKSLQAIQVANRLSQRLQQPVAAAILFRHPQLGELAQALGQPAASVAGTTGTAPPSPPTAEYPELAMELELQPGSGTPIFCIHPADGMSWSYAGLARHLPGVPLIGIQSPGMLQQQPATWNHMIDQYLALIRSRWQGPYRLLGWSMGGGIAQTLAARLQQLGETVEHLFLLDAYPADHWRNAEPPQRRDGLLMLLDDITDANDAQGEPRSETDLLNVLQAPGSPLAQYNADLLLRLADTAVQNMLQYRQAEHPLFCGDVLLFRASQRRPDEPDWILWNAYIQGRIERVNLDCNHFQMHRQGPLATVGQTIARRLQLHSEPEPIA
ncbi:amino acid adenylation domain-containing protein [Ketobacter sp.]|uniref:amino acid adenylation domain-containing protein n=1 Tax=Ketobacter sp. TaxID=2083498 RepID=UPI0025C2DB9A|nr:amino acid adenylation domain-containing protein [Ketobacter sp.]